LSGIVEAAQVADLGNAGPPRQFGVRIAKTF